MFFFSGLLAPLLVAIVLAYLLEWPTVRLERIGLSRTWATSLVLILFVGILLCWLCGAAGGLAAGIYLIRDMPGMLNKLSVFCHYAAALSGVNGCRHHRCDGGKYAQSDADGGRLGE